jgi:hypothetical protein
MSAPDSSNSKAPPSLLADTAKGSQANGSRILANLEGRVEPPTDKTRRARAPAVLVALLVVAAGGWGAWHLQQRTRGEHAEAVVSAGPVASQTAAAPVGASAGQVIAKAAVPEAASASQAATIVAADTDNKDSEFSADVAASAAGGTDGNRLSRALANDAAASGAPADAAKNAKPAAVATSHARHERETASANAKHETANRRHASAAALAQEKKDKQRTAQKATASKDDPDADLLAALVARTKPADAKADAKADANGGTTRVSASTNGGNARLAQQVKECGTRGFFEDQLCRWRVCDGHWGKDPACPGSAPPARPQ